MQVARKLKRALGVRFSSRALARNPNVYLRQLTRRFHSFRELVGCLAAERPITILQVGANDGITGDPIGDLVLNEPEKIRALLIEPQRAAFARLSQRYAKSTHVKLLNVAIGKEAGQQSIYSLNQTVAQKNGRTLGDDLGSFNRSHILRHLNQAKRKAGLALSEKELEALIVEETVSVMPLSQALEEAGFPQPDVFLVDTEGFDAEIIRMMLADRWRPQLLQYEYSNLSASDRRNISESLRRAGYRLWADHADVWGQNIQTDTSPPAS
ncbi:MAG: hypothetical protein M2R45_04146 [Verrucomicrobia subdivision 3 bacterium]|nr:hypothetical protein [Limisphaerales bacterium]MCS1417715.1 hypothetical protein [Limisphaerales bacterium]